MLMRSRPLPVIVAAVLLVLLRVCFKILTGHLSACGKSKMLGEYCPTQGMH